MAKVDRKILMAVGVIALVLLAAYLYKLYSVPKLLPNPPIRVVPVHKEDFEMIEDDGYRGVPSTGQILKGQGLQGPKCGIREGEHLGYKYQIPEELPSVEDLMPEQRACDSYYDPEAAQDVPYVFTYPLTGALTKTRNEQAGDMWRGDLDMPARDPNCDFKSIFNSGDQYLHGAFADYTYKSHELIGKNCTDDIWVRDAPIRVANEELIQDYE